MKRKTVFKALLILGAFFVLSALAFYAWLHGDIPQIADINDLEYGKTLNIQPSYGNVWCHSFGFKGATYYYRLHLSKTDFEKTGVSSLPRSSTTERGDAPIWWNPPAGAIWYVRPSMKHGSDDFYIYDADRELFFARCEI